MTSDRRAPLQIIAELAQGFEGKPLQSELLIVAAAAAGADAVKFQLVYADELATPEYQHYALFRSLEMTDEVWMSLAEKAADLGIGLQLDIFGQRSLDLASRIGAGTVKLHGTDIANPGLLKAVAQSDVPRVMLGAGGATAQEIDTALDVLKDKTVDLLLGFQAYPTPTEDNHVDRLRILHQRYKGRERVILGFADHADPESPLRFGIAAAALGAGARTVEKHLTLGRNMQLEDFESALNPDQFGEFVTVLRGVDAAIGAASGTEDFGMSEKELGYRQMIRRHVVSARDLPAGRTLEPDDVVLKRAAIEDPLTEMDAAIGRTLRADTTANSPLTRDLLGLSNDA